jgi:hypothetical protein
MEHTNGLFIVDTGGPFCLLDKSLEPMLGKPLKTTKVNSMYGTETGHLYAAPTLYLGNVQLRTGDRVATWDFKRLSNDLNRMPHSNVRLMGLLGMDCLQNYFIQLDFAAGKMRFLDPGQAGSEDLGKAFPLAVSHGYVFVRENLPGVKNVKSQIDTGCDYDGWLTPKLFRQWTNSSSSTVHDGVHCPNGVFWGYHYTNIDLHRGVNIKGWEPVNGLGLGFLARHLVSFDFPHRTMYLKRTTAGPLHPIKK